MWNGVDFGNYNFEKGDLQETNWKFATFVPPLDTYKDSQYVKLFNSSNLSLTSKTVKVSVQDVLNQPSTSSKCTSSKYTFKFVSDFAGFVDYSHILPFKELNYQFEQYLVKLEQEEFKHVLDLPSFDPVDYLLSSDFDEVDVSNVIPYPKDEQEEDEEQEVTFLKLKGCSKFGNDILVDSFGFLYSLNDKKFEN